MTGRSPARVPALVALVATTVALVVVITSGGRADGGPGASGGSKPVDTSTPTAQRRARKARRSYTVKPGDTPSGIAAKTGVSLDALLAANPEAEPAALSPGQKLKLP